jgi:DNA-binding MurR/RpiR family transcriptional regulator
MTIAEIQDRLHAAIPTAAPAVRKALIWLVQHTPEVAWKQAESIAREARVSPASVVRAVQSAGFQGYLDLQSQIRDQGPAVPVAWQLFQKPREVQPIDSIGLVLSQEIANLEQLSPLLRPQLAPLIDWLLMRRHIVVTASLMTAGLAEHLALNFRYLLGGVEFVDAASSQAWMHLRDLRSDDGVIGLSYPRYAARTSAFLARSLRQTPHNIWITDLGGPAVPTAEMIIRLPSASQSHYSSTVTLMAFIHIVAHELAEREPERVRQNLEDADRIWQDLNGG